MFGTRETIIDYWWIPGDATRWITAGLDINTLYRWWISAIRRRGSTGSTVTIYRGSCRSTDPTRRASRHRGIVSSPASNEVRAASPANERYVALLRPLLLSLLYLCTRVARVLPRTRARSEMSLVSELVGQGLVFFASRLTLWGAVAIISARHACINHNNIEDHLVVSFARLPWCPSYVHYAQVGM